MATGGGESVGVWWRRSFPWLSANPRSVGGVGGSRAIAVNLVLRAPAPTSVNMALPQGPTNQKTVVRPRSGRERGVGSSRWTRSCEINLTVERFYCSHKMLQNDVKFLKILYKQKNVMFVIFLSLLHVKTGCRQPKRRTINLGFLEL
jgi:hypothetical protein